MISVLHVPLGSLICMSLTFYVGRKKNNIFFIDCRTNYNRSPELRMNIVRNVNSLAAMKETKILVLKLMALIVWR